MTGYEQSDVKFYGESNDSKHVTLAHCTKKFYTTTSKKSRNSWIFKKGDGCSWAGFFILVGKIRYTDSKWSLKPVEYDAKKSSVLSWTKCGQVRLQSERVVRNREIRHKIHTKTPVLPSSGRIWPNPICVSIISTIGFPTIRVLTAGWNLTSR